MNLFNKIRMGYAIVESNKLDDWRQFLKQGLGLHLEAETDSMLAFRIDEHARRFIVRKGPAEDFVALGYQVDGTAAMHEIQRRLDARDIAVETGSVIEALDRGVSSFVRVIGPKGLPVELFTEATMGKGPLNMLSSGFVTGASGMGHVAMTSKQPEKVLRFWQEIFDARLSDRVSQKLAGVMLDITFLRFNERHHSMAVAAPRGLRLDPIRTKCQHLNMVASSLGDVTGAFERLRDLGYEMAHEIGQHPNDKEISFYVFSPSGFEIELGWDALKVDEATWKTGQHNAISTWGHKPERNSALDNLRLNLGNFVRGLRSAVKPEHSPIKG